MRELQVRMEGYMNQLDSKIMKMYDQEMLMDLLNRERLNQFQNHLNVSFEFECKFASRKYRAFLVDKIFEAGGLCQISDKNVIFLAVSLFDRYYSSATEKFKQWKQDRVENPEN